jgi:hypothetical protein
MVNKIAFFAPDKSTQKKICPDQVFDSYCQQLKACTLSRKDLSGICPECLGQIF